MFDLGGYVVGICGVECILVVIWLDFDLVFGDGFVCFVVDELEVFGIGYVVVVRGKGGSVWGGCEDVVDEYCFWVVDYYIVVCFDII